MKDFDLEKFMNEFNTEHELQPYNYERYLAVNPNLTVKMYKHLRDNHCEWKILCGLRVEIKGTTEVLNEVWFRKNNNGYKQSEIYRFRFIPKNYLTLNTW
jgi:hypothetical protein